MPEEGQCENLGATKTSSNLVTFSPMILPAKSSVLGELLLLVFTLRLTSDFLFLPINFFSIKILLKTFLTFNTHTPLNYFTGFCTVGKITFQYLQEKNVNYMPTNISTGHQKRLKLVFSREYVLTIVTTICILFQINIPQSTVKLLVICFKIN